MKEYLKKLILNWRYKRAKKKAIQLKLKTGIKHMVIPLKKGRFMVVNKYSVRKASKKIINFSWRKAQKNAIFVTK